MREKTCCFTGHRVILESEGAVKARLMGILEGLIYQGYCYFGAGGARGFDSLAAKTVLEFKEKYKDIHLILVLPFYNQYEAEKGWSTAEIEAYHYLKENASKVVHMQKFYSKGCYYRRNEHLVDHSSVCISYQYKSVGGTAYTTRYAEKQKVAVINCFKSYTSVDERENLCYHTEK